MISVWITCHLDSLSLWFCHQSPGYKRRKERRKERREGEREGRERGRGEKKKKKKFKRVPFLYSARMLKYATVCLSSEMWWHIIKVRFTAKALIFKIKYKLEMHLWSNLPDLAPAWVTTRSALWRHQSMMVNRMDLLFLGSTLSSGSYIQPAYLCHLWSNPTEESSNCRVPKDKL